MTLAVSAVSEQGLKTIRTDVDTPGKRGRKESSGLLTPSKRLKKDDHAQALAALNSPSSPKMKKGGKKAGGNVDDEMERMAAQLVILSQAAIHHEDETPAKAPKSQSKGASASKTATFTAPVSTATPAVPTKKKKNYKLCPCCGERGHGVRSCPTKAAAAASEKSNLSKTTKGKASAKKQVGAITSNLKITPEMAKEASTTAGGSLPTSPTSVATPSKSATGADNVSARGANGATSAPSAKRGSKKAAGSKSKGCTNCRVRTHQTSVCPYVNGTPGGLAGVALGRHPGDNGETSVMMGSPVISETAAGLPYRNTLPSPLFTGLPAPHSVPGHKLGVMTLTSGANGHMTTKSAHSSHMMAGALPRLQFPDKPYMSPLSYADFQSSPPLLAQPSPLNSPLPPSANQHYSKLHHLSVPVMHIDDASISKDATTSVQSPRASSTAPSTTSAGNGTSSGPGTGRANMTNRKNSRYLCKQCFQRGHNGGACPRASYTATPSSSPAHPPIRPTLKEASTMKSLLYSIVSGPSSAPSSPVPTVEKAIAAPATKTEPLGVSAK
eukprot:GFYU01006755.1.p1 GENE.GFYU01006755.1~~GFYU01006755.1.p1  ORF type:complete len:554 (+),score=135.50 GFYU01006755.1:316-1977(+)